MTVLTAAHYCDDMPFVRMFRSKQRYFHTCSHSSVIPEKHQKIDCNVKQKYFPAGCFLFYIFCIYDLQYGKKILNTCLIFLHSFSPRLVHQQDNFQQEAHQPILSYSLIDTLPKRTLMWSHNISAPLALLSCFTDISFKHKRNL